MEAVTIAGVAVVVVGGIFSFLDLLADLGIQVSTSKSSGNSSPVFGGCLLASQRRVKKVAGMNI
ncbi:MAG: hypothetical protein HY888_06180 [Deltaproteobacteria bacterium]|nr:hypothetical protein [Deltaproteobacteria bacterium]